MPTLFKSLAPHRRGPYSGYIYPRPRTWLPKVATLVRCASGYHVCTLVQLPQWLEAEIYPVEARGKPLVEADKVIYGQIRLGARCKLWTPRRAVQFAIDVAEHVEHYYSAHCDDGAARRYLDEATALLGPGPESPPMIPTPEGISEAEWQGRRLGTYLGLTPEQIDEAVAFHKELGC